MLTADTQNNQDLSIWQAESLRVTCFPSPIKEFKTENIWQEVIGEPSENTIVRAREGFRQDEGHVNGRQFILASQPARIDWLIGPNEENGEMVIGNFQESLNEFLEIMIRWFKISPPLRRLAFGTVLVSPVNDRESGYELLGKYLPNVKLDPIGASDFLYQINRPRNSLSQISDLLINRLTRWSVLKRGVVGFDILLNSPTNIFPSSESLACRLELDINTSADYKGDLATEKLTTIFDELVFLTKEIAINGDIP